MNMIELLIPSVAMIGLVGVELYILAKIDIFWKKRKGRYLCKINLS